MRQFEHMLFVIFGLLFSTMKTKHEIYNKQIFLQPWMDNNIHIKALQR